jgi:N4-gp56 family major capsid protein
MAAPYAGNYTANPTNFGALQTDQIKVWSRQIWQEARDKSFLNQFTGKSDDSMVQRVTELRKSVKGNQAYITLVHDLVGDGVMGDAQLEGMEEALSQDDCLIKFDQIRNAVNNKGRMAEQKSVVAFREQAKNKLSYWLANRCDQMGILSMSGIKWTKAMNGANRPGVTGPDGASGYNLSDHESAGDVTVPSDERAFECLSTGDLGVATINATTGFNESLAANGALKYECLQRLKEKAISNYVRPIRTKNGQESYNVFVSPKGMLQLKRDPEFRENLLHAMPRSKENPLFTGMAMIMQDGLVIHEYRLMFTTLGAGATNKFGGSGNVEGARALLCGAQALAMADISLPYWDEELKDYKNRPGISVGKMVGFKKPQFKSIYAASNDKVDFGIMTLDHAI